jgi:hypothetical protein
VYKKDWKGFGDWLGTGTIASYNIKYRSYEDANAGQWIKMPLDF